MSKCAFGATKVEYLGHIISHGKVSMDATKVTCMVNWPVPKSIKELRGFLGLTGYYRRFIKDYGTIARPLTDMLKKNNYIWTDQSLTAFEKLKVAMVTAPVLALPDFTKEFVVEADASNQGIGAVLSQKGKPIAYFSRALSLRHQTLSVYDKKMMAILGAVKRWNAYLMGKSYKIQTDHNRLRFLLDQKTTTPAQQKWVLKMMGYDYQVIYKKGSNNVVADSLSRRS